MRTTHADRGSSRSNVENDGNANQSLKYKTPTSSLQAPQGSGPSGPAQSPRGESASGDLRAENDVLTTRQVAEYLKVSCRKIRQLAELWDTTDGLEGLRGFKIGQKLWRFHRKDIEDFFG